MMKVSKTQYLFNLIIQLFSHHKYQVSEYVGQLSPQKQAIIVNTQSLGEPTKDSVFEKIEISVQIIAPTDKRNEIQSDLVEIKNVLRHCGLNTTKSDEMFRIDPETQYLNGLVHFNFTR